MERTFVQENDALDWHIALLHKRAENVIRLCAHAVVAAPGTQQKLFIRGTELGVAQQEQPGVFLRERARLVQESHIDLFQQAVALLAVAMAAASYQILPGALPP